MPDIAMCRNTECPSRGRCYRYLAKPDKQQTYMPFVVPKGRRKCDSFRPMSKGTK